MRLFLPFSLWILSLARPDFKSVPFLELDEHTGGSGAYRHRASRGEERREERTEKRVLPSFGSFSEPLARSEGWTGGKTMKKILIGKEKKRGMEKAQGIHIHSLPKGVHAVSLPIENESISELKRKFNVSLNTGESILPPITDNIQSSEWPPQRSTLPPNGGEFNKYTHLFFSGLIKAGKEKRGQMKEEDGEYLTERKRIPVIRALARSKPIVSIDDIADPPNHISISPIVSITPHTPVSTTHRIGKRHRKRSKKDFQKGFKDFSMSFTPLEEKSEFTTLMSPSVDVETTQFVENLADSIEKEETEVVNRRREHRKGNYGVNPLMYKVVDGVLYDRAGQPVRRVDIPLRDEPRRHKSYLGPAKTVMDHRIEHDEVSIHSTNHLFYEATTPFSPHTSSFDFDSPSLTLDPLPLPTAAMVSFPQSTTPFHWGQPLTTTVSPVMRDGKVPPPFPFSNCYMNTDGFMCCNRDLEGIIRAAYSTLPCRRSGCSVQHIVKRVRSEVEKRFRSPFEVIASTGDFAMHAHFVGDLTCKIEMEGRFIATYATVTKSSSPSSLIDYLMLPRDRSIVTPKESLTKKRRKIVSNQTIPPPIPLPAGRFNGGTVQTPTTEESLDYLQTSTLSTTIPNISVSFDDQLDAPSIDVTKPDDNFHRVVPFHERSRGKNDFH